MSSRMVMEIIIYLKLQYFFLYQIKISIIVDLKRDDLQFIDFWIRF